MMATNQHAGTKDGSGDSGDDTAASSRNTIKPFAVCTDVELGPLLPAVDGSDNGGDDGADEAFRQVWAKVQKNKQASPATGAAHQATVVEATSTLLLDKTIKENNCVPVMHGFDSTNLFAQAVHVSFYKHYPLRLGPDVIWLTILQGLAKHIDQDPEKQRKHFVNFEGTQTLVIRRPEFVKGSPNNNDWTTVFPQFAEMVQQYIGKEKVSTMTCDFSTSTSTDRICSHIALMDTVKHYFKFRALCGCGIPSIELAGTTEDWIDLRKKAEFLCEFDDLEWWTDELFPILDQFVKAARGTPDVKFWKSVCNICGLSGRWLEYVTGWVQVFFPYNTFGKRNTTVTEWRTNYESGTGKETEDFNRGVTPVSGGGPFFQTNPDAGVGLALKKIPVGVSQAPFEYVDASTGRKFDMTFNAGVVAIVQDQTTRAIEPITGWAVLDHGEIPSRKRKNDAVIS